MTGIVYKKGFFRIIIISLNLMYLILLVQIILKLLILLNLLILRIFLKVIEPENVNQIIFFF